MSEDTEQPNAPDGSVQNNDLFDREIAKLQDKLDKFMLTRAYESGVRLAQTEASLGAFKKARRMLVKWNKSNTESTNGA